MNGRVVGLGWFWVKSNMIFLKPLSLLMFPIKPVSSTLIVNVSSAICWNLPNDMSSVFTLLPCVWPDSRFDLPIISEPSSHGCNSLAMLESMFDDVKRMDKRQFLYQVMHHQEFVTHQLSIDEKIITVIQQVKLQVLSFGMIVSSALMIWKGLMVVTGSESPIVVVLSGSMEPAFQVSINQSIKYIQDYCITFTPWFFAFGPIFCRGETCSF